MVRKTLLFLVTEDWYFVSHRLALAEAAHRDGYRVVVATRVRSHGEAIRAAGAELVPLRMAREGRSPFGEFLALWEIIRLYRREKPSVAHHIAMKPIVYGSIAARIAGTPQVIHAFAGLGYAFIGQSRRRRIFSHLSAKVLRWCARSPNAVVLVQNEEDRALLVEKGIATPERTRLIRGSGVDLAAFSVSPEPPGPPIVVCPARMLREKGIVEFAAAAAVLRAEAISARFVLVGGEDPANPAHVDRQVIEGWVAEGDVEWWGHRTDMADVFANCAIVCLPSYREGLPKALLEAMASGRSIITTDAPGCREVVRPGENGLLVPVRDVAALVNALRTLLQDPVLRVQMGVAGRLRAEREFDVTSVVAETLQLYQASPQ